MGPSSKRAATPCSLLTTLFALLLTAGCSEDSPEVVVYTSFDSIFAEKIFADFTAQTGIRVRPVFDTEETKTLGLVRRLLAERGDPQADVFWSGECLRTCMLEAEGALEPYASPSAAGIDARWRTDGWTGFGARMRVIVYNTERVVEPPTDLLDPKWRGRIAIANPRFGTTAAHVAALYAAWGPERAHEYFVRLKANDPIVAGGNSHVRDLVARGVVDVGLTDTDDVWVGIDRGDPIAMVPAEPIVLIPNSAALIRGAKHPDAARKFLDFLLDEQRERMMAEGRARQMPVRASVPTPAGVPRAGDYDALNVDWGKANAGSEEALRDVLGILGL